MTAVPLTRSPLEVHTATMRLLLAAVTLPLALAGCGGGTDRAGESHPTPSAWTAAEAGRHYLELVAPGNAVGEQWTALAAQKPRPGWRKFRALCGALADSDDSLMRGLAVGRWPSAAQDEVDAMVAKLAARRSGYLDCRDASTEQGMAEALASQPAEAGEAQAVRVALGLPSVG